MLAFGARRYQVLRNVIDSVTSRLDRKTNGVISRVKMQQQYPHILTLAHKQIRKVQNKMLHRVAK